MLAEVDQGFPKRVPTPERGDINLLLGKTTLQHLVFINKDYLVACSSDNSPKIYTALLYTIKETPHDYCRYRVPELPFSVLCPQTEVPISQKNYCELHSMLTLTWQSRSDYK